MYSVLFIFASVAVAWGAYCYWSIRTERLKASEARAAQSPLHGPWLPKAEQETSWLVHEERYFLEPDSGKKGAHRVLCEERYCGLLTGAVVASLPPRPIARAKNLSEGREILQFFREVSVTGNRAA